MSVYSPESKISLYRDTVQCWAGRGRWWRLPYTSDTFCWCANSYLAGSMPIEGSVCSLHLKWLFGSLGYLYSIFSCSRMIKCYKLDLHSLLPFSYPNILVTWFNRPPHVTAERCTLHNTYGFSFQHSSLQQVFCTPSRTISLIVHRVLRKITKIKR